MPTTRPRYTVTDSGHIGELLDLAGQHWSDVEDRKQLLLRLVETGAAGIAHERQQRAIGAVRTRQLEAMRRSRDLIDVDLLRGEAAWR